jgi:hypothetical protein
MGLKQEKILLIVTVILSCVICTAYGNSNACLKTVDSAVFPTCEIVNHFSLSPFAPPNSGFECLAKWENTIYLGKGMTTFHLVSSLIL